MGERRKKSSQAKPINGIADFGDYHSAHGNRLYHL